jgi:hypothetical protein
MTNLSPDEIKKSLVSSLSNPDENISRAIMLRAGGRPDLVKKAISTGTGLVAYDLQAPAKNLYPVNTPWVPEGQRAGHMAYTTADRAAPYRTLG